MIDNIISILKEYEKLDKKISYELSNKNWIRNHDIEYNYIISNYDMNNFKSFSHILYNIKNNIKKHPQCKACNKDVSFFSYNKGYRVYSSNIMKIDEK